MTKLDQFESVFKSADKDIYTHQHIEIGHALVVSDLTEAAAAPLLAATRSFLAVLGSETRWSHLPGDDFSNVGELLSQVDERAPDLIVTYRHLHSDAWRWPYSLGEYVDVLTQVSTAPVMVLPHPVAERALPHSLRDTDRVMAVTDHLTGDARLVDIAVRFTAAGGRCWLTHVESKRDFDRLLDVIAKIPEIDTDDAREMIHAQLLKEPGDYIRSCRESIQAADLDLTIEELVSMADRVAEYRRWVEEHEIDLLIMNTLDADQLAMHGGAYPLAVELRGVALLML